MSQEEWEKCSRYTRAKTHFAGFENLFSFLLTVVVLIFFLPLYFREWSLSFGVGVWEASILTAVFLLVLQQFGLPFDWYRQFRLEDKFGFNNQTKRLWLSDKCKEFVLGCFLITLLLALVHFLYAQISVISPDYWWVFCFPCPLSVPTGFDGFMAKVYYPTF